MSIFRNMLRTLLAAGTLGMAMMAVSTGASAQAKAPEKTQDKVVYHIDNSEAQATKGLRNIRNHLDVAPDTRIVVVTHADGVKFLMEGAKDARTPTSTTPPWSAHSRRAA